MNSFRKQVVTEDKDEKELIPTYNLVDNDLEGERAWLKFAPQCLKWAPSAKELLDRWYRHRFTIFVREEFIKRKQNPPRPIGSEEIFFKTYPYLKPKWLKVKKTSQSIEPTSALLLDRWFKQRKYEFKKNWLKRNRCADKFNIANQKFVYANRGSLCNIRPRMDGIAFWFNNIAVICILLLLAVILWKKNFKLF